MYNLFRQYVAALIVAVLMLPGIALSAGEGHRDIRVATPWPAQNTIIAMLGYGDSIVGTSDIAKRIPLFRQIYPGIDQVPAISVSSSHEVNPEQVIALKVQLLFIPQNMRLSQPEMLAKAGVKTLELKANSMAALRQRITLTAQALGPDAEQVDTRYQRYFDRNVALIRQRLNDLPESERITVYHSMGSPLMTSGRPSLNQDWMDLAGARNVAESWFAAKKNSSGEVPLEKVIAADPEVIIAMNSRDAQDIRQSSAWQGTAAVRHQRVYANPQGLFWWCRETSEAALQILWLAKTLYPQRFADIDMAKETYDFYHDFFAISLSSQQIATILNP
ncbi:ABC transporter substrate-binding protein [Brenneria izadpanahii]|uniref:ABC transporter substrate-binding protein n=1 Tax=Brenneria izadpanahii TaxID=2722756 RepID=A0ABX7URS7_9GAMM|nr:ABC transporter substrate-binding protein [Brenneria izadpanahii]